MRPIRLQLVGLRSWKAERELKFGGIDLAAVIGPTGAGKSSILEAIVYALYNAATYDRRGVGSLISSDATTMSVTLDFEADGEIWRVTRSTSRNSYPPSVHKLTCLTNPSEHPTVEGERGVNPVIEQLIGLDLGQFLTAVLLPQGRFQTLLMATAGERAAVLKGVFRLDELDDIRERAATLRRDQVEPMLDEKRTARAELLSDPEGALVQATAEGERCLEMVEKLEETKGRYDDLIARVDQLERAASQARAQHGALLTATAAIPSLESALAAEVEIAEITTGLRSARENHLARRREAQSKIDAAAGAGLTIQTLTTAQNVLEGALLALPALDLETEALKSAFETLAEQRRELESSIREHSQEMEQLSEIEAIVVRLRGEAAERSTRRTDAVDALRALRDAEGEATQARAALVEHEEQLGSASADAVEATAKAEADRAAARGAEAVLEAARKAHEIAHVAAGLRPGESCPVCRRELPPGFTAPEAPEALQSAESEASRLRSLAEESAAAAHRSQAKVEALQERITGLRKGKDAVENNCADLREKAGDLIGPVDLGREDVDMLASLNEEAATATLAYEKADRELSATKARLATAADGMAQRGRACTDREQELDIEAGRIERGRTTQASALAGLPEEFKPTAETIEAIRAASEICSARLDEIQMHHVAVGEATIEVERLDERLNELAVERTEKVDAPRREAVGCAREIAAKIRELQPDVELLSAPSDGAAITEHVNWVQNIAAVATELAETLRIEAEGDEASASRTRSESAEVLTSAGRVVDKTLTTAADLNNELNGWRAGLLTANRARESASEQIPRAALLDSQIVKLRARRDALEEVARLLSDGHFIRWLVERRQQLLLVVASEIFAGMTGDRYRFAADFTIIDARTGIARTPRTLSGGESFMASLALALGMAEIAARSGGRIGSLYLDEGFGALDPNALDEAITALELRARTGQMVIIISHVDAVAQRIERVLKISPDPAGSSAEWLDDEDRESFLLGAASAGA